MADSEQHPDIEAAIEKAQTATASIEEKSDEAAALLSNAQQSQVDAEAAATSAQTSQTEIDAILAQVKTARDEVLASREKSTTDSAKTAEIARIADEKDVRVAEYERKLADLTKEHEELKDKLDGLLPGATGIGLAKSFHSRKNALKEPIKRYLLLFLVSIAGFIGLGYWALWEADIETINDFILFALERFPLILGLVLLEEFSRRQFHALSKLEEDYAYKESISLAFEGYKEAMSDIDSTDSTTLANNLSQKVLTTLSQRPGRLMEVEQEQSMSTDDLIKAVAAAGSEANSIDLFAQALHKLRSSVKGSFLKLTIIILIAALIGVGSGYYLSKTQNPSSGDAVEIAE